MRNLANLTMFGGLAVVLATACGNREALSAPAPEGADIESSTATLGPQPQLTPVVLASAPEQDRLYNLALADGSVYFAGGVSIPPPPESGQRDDERGIVRRVPVAGGAVQEIWTGVGQVNDLAVGSDVVYFLAYDFIDRDGFLNRVPKTGGVATELGSWISHGSTHSLTLDVQTVYWTHSAGAGTFVIRTSGVDGSSTTLADSQTIGSGANLILFDRGFLYFGNLSTVYKLAADGATPPSALYSPGTEITALAIAPAGDALYVGHADPADATRGVLARIDLREGETRQLASTATRVISLATDARTVYLGTSTDASGNAQLARIGAHGGPVRVLLTGAFTPAALAVDATSLYWVDAFGRTVNKAAR